MVAPIELLKKQRGGTEVLRRPHTIKTVNKPLTFRPNTYAFNWFCHVTYCSSIGLKIRCCYLSWTRGTENNFRTFRLRSDENFECRVNSRLLGDGTQLLNFRKWPRPLPPHDASCNSESSRSVSPQMSMASLGSACSPTPHTYATLCSSACLSLYHIYLGCHLSSLGYSGAGAEG